MSAATVPEDQRRTMHSAQGRALLSCGGPLSRRRADVRPPRPVAEGLRTGQFTRRLTFWRDCRSLLDAASGEGQVAPFLSRRPLRRPACATGVAGRESGGPRAPSSPGRASSWSCSAPESALEALRRRVTGLPKRGYLEAAPSVRGGLESALSAPLCRRHCCVRSIYVSGTARQTSDRRMALRSGGLAIAFPAVLRRTSRGRGTGCRETRLLGRRLGASRWPACRFVPGRAECHPTG
jgi:hypothetical protein